MINTVDERRDVRVGLSFLRKSPMTELAVHQKTDRDRENRAHNLCGIVAITFVWVEMHRVQDAVKN